MVGVAAPVQSKFRQLAVAVSVMTGALPLLASINTLSALVGTEAPPDPPDVVLQFVVVAASQFPVPPTQYRFAMINPSYMTDIVNSPVEASALKR